MDLNNLEIYLLAKRLSEIAWNIYQGLSKNLQFGIGNQFVDATDSIGANIAEGFGRYHYKDSIKFYYYARGSLFECKHWIALIENRQLSKKEYIDEYNQIIEIEGIKLNSFVNSIKSRIK